MFRQYALVLVLAGLALGPLAAPLSAQDAVVLSGRVVDSFGDPVAGAAGVLVSLSGYRTEVLSAADGSYAFEDLPPGEYQQLFTADGYVPQVSGVVIDVGASAPRVVRLLPLVPAGLSGTVRDPQGLALPGALVELIPLDSAAMPVGEAGQFVSAGPAGEFVFTPLRSGAWRLVASLPGFVAAEQIVDVSFGRLATVDLALELNFALAEEVVVVGSRRAAGQRAISESPVPIDVLGREDLASRSRTDTVELLRSLAPSFNVSTQPISDAATVIRPVNLRNLAPDHLLVLVNGKRRHRGAVIAWLGNGLSDGSQGPDVASIPAIALRQVELLRDGAAAQYGSDAIAGVVNFQLNDAREGGSFELLTGSYLHDNVGDPATCQTSLPGYSHDCRAIGGLAQLQALSANAGLPLGPTGFANLSLEVGRADPTNRSVQREDAAALIDAGNEFVRSPAQVWGRPAVDGDLKLFGNFGADFGLFRPYGHVSYARRDTVGGFYYRHPHTRSGVFHGPEVDGSPSLLVGDASLAAGRGAVCPSVPIVDGRPDSAALALVDSSPDCFTLYNRFPGGFTPQFGGVLNDASAVGGVRYLRPDGFGWDVSASIGRSFIDQLLTHSVNASLGLDTPTTFRPGTSEQVETNLNFDVTMPLPRGFHLAAGGEWRNEVFALGAGDTASWTIGPYAEQGFSSSSNGFNGYRPDTAAGRWGRTNVAGYADLEYREPGGGWTLAGAVRAEHFADFGPTLNGKIAGRVRLASLVSLRGAVSTGFRAPTPGQQHAFNVTTAFIDGGLVNRGVVPSTSAVALSRGGGQLQPERSRHASLGVVVAGERFHVAVDGFFVDLRERLSLSQEISLTPPEVLILLSEGIPEARNFPVFRFFVNDFGTTTAGVDVAWRVAPHDRLSFGGLYNYTSTSLHSLSGRVISRFRVHTLENGLPRSRAQAWLRPQLGPVSLLLRYQWYGGYWDSEDGRNAADLGVISVPWHYPAYGGVGLLDIEGTLPLADDLDVSVGVENLLGGYPDVNPYGPLTVGNRYGQFSPFGFDGPYLYGRLVYRWGSR